MLQTSSPQPFLRRFVELSSSTSTSQPSSALRFWATARCLFAHVGFVRAACLPAAVRDFQSLVA
jgi:hypothetical protein